MNFNQILSSIFLVTILINSCSGIYLRVILETGLEIAGLIQGAARAPFSKDTKCGHGIGATCTVRVYNQITSGGKINVACRSADDTIGPRDIEVNDQMSFNFGFKGSLDIGPNTQFWCTLKLPDLSGSVTFDVYNGDAPLYDNHWYVRDEGIWLRTDPYESSYDNSLFYVWTQGDDNKVRLFSASYRLWQDRTEDGGGSGANMVDVVYNARYKDVPPEWNDVTSAVTVCDYDCAVLYQWDSSRGENSRLQSDGMGCTDFYLTNFEDRTSSVGGCWKKNTQKPLTTFPASSNRSMNRFNGETSEQSRQPNFNFDNNPANWFFNQMINNQNQMWNNNRYG